MSTTPLQVDAAKATTMSSLHRESPYLGFEPFRENEGGKAQLRASFDKECVPGSDRSIGAIMAR
jgi:hypothetical protein